MIYEVTMPKMGESLIEGTLIKWHKKVGDFVKKDEPLFDIATDKVDTEIPSPEEGYLVKILIEEGTTVEIGTVVAKISKENVKVAPSEKPRNEEKPLQQVENKQDIVDESKEKNSENHQDITKSDKFLSPLVKSIMQKEGISFEEIKNLNGSGIDGRITKNDILNYINNRQSDKYQIKQNEDEKPKIVEFKGETLEYDMDNMRYKIAQNMVKSRDTAVHVSEVIEADVSGIVKFLKDNKQKIREKYNVNLTFTAIVAEIVSKALMLFPLMNANIDGKKIIEKKYVNLGIAIALEPNGLVVPNIKNAHELNLIGIAKKLDDLKYRANNKKLIIDDFTDGTFTITNYGVFGTLFGAPIINVPEVAILGVGAIKKRVVVKTIDDEDVILVRDMVYLSLSHDHRLIDGMLGGKFLKHLKDSLENYKFNNI
jgi:2-oxoglutarate dehydrogenase E2 component (dihydrolipoamide succinyltransferase)